MESAATAHGLSGTAAVGRRAASAQRVAIVLAYAVGFYLLLPGLLWRLGGRLDALLSLPPLPGPAARAGAIPAGVGLAWLAWSMAFLCRRGVGLPISHLPPRRLVESGPYALLRHPIYVGYSAAFSGFGLLAGSAGRGVLAAALLTAGWLLYALGFEEPRLLSRYGAVYERYRRAVPLLVPRFRCGAGGRSGLAARALGALWARLRRPVERLANRTVLARVGCTVWVTYGVLMATGGAVMGAWIAGLLGAAGLSGGQIAFYLLGLAVSLVAGGRLVWLAYQWRSLLARPGRTLATVGFVSWGGLLGMLAFPIVFGLATGADPLWLVDRTVLPSLACLALGRLGCLTYGCCYGRPSARGIRWTCAEAKVVRERGAEGTVARVPTQLLEAGLGLAILPVAVAVTASGAPSGVCTAVILLLYAIGRFPSDLLREEPRFGRLGLTAGQTAGGLLFVASLAFLLVARGPPGWDGWALAVDPTAGGAWPAVVGASLVGLVACGLHWRAVGRWV